MSTKKPHQHNANQIDEHETRRMDGLGRVVLPIDWRRGAGMEINTYINIHFISYTVVLVSAEAEELQKQEKTAWQSAAAAFPAEYQSLIRTIAGLCSKESETEQNRRTYFFSRKMDKLGRLVIPKEFREPLALEQGTSINIYTNGKVIVLIPQKFDKAPAALKNMLFAASAFPLKYQPLLLNIAATAAGIEDIPAVPKAASEKKASRKSGGKDISPTV